MKFFDWFSVVAAIRRDGDEVMVIGRPKVALNEEARRVAEIMQAQYPDTEVLIAPVDASENVALVDRIEQGGRYD